MSFDGTIRYTPGEIAPELIHDGKAYIGLQFPAPAFSQCVTLYVNGVPRDPVDLTVDGDSAIDGQFIEYFAFADKDGRPLPPKAWVIRLLWERETYPVETRYLIKRKPHRPDEGLF